MTDERVDALLRRLDVQSRPDPAFVAATADMLRPRVRAARVQDMSRIGRLRRDLRRGLAPPLLPRYRDRSRSRASPSSCSWLPLQPRSSSRSFQPERPNRERATGRRSRRRAQGDRRRQWVESLDHVGWPERQAREPVPRWTDRRLLEGRSRWRPAHIQRNRRAGSIRADLGQTVTWAGCVDTWSPNSHAIASEVKVDGTSRISSPMRRPGGRLVTPDGMVAHCPVWSPDSRSIAFAQDLSTGSSVLSVMRADGSDIHSVSGDIGGASVAGANSWSIDGTWIYFTTGGDNGSIWRANVALARAPN